MVEKRLGCMECCGVSCEDPHRPVVRAVCDVVAAQQRWRLRSRSPARRVLDRIRLAKPPAPYDTCRCMSSKANRLVLHFWLRVRSHKFIVWFWNVACHLHVREHLTSYASEPLSIAHFMPARGQSYTVQPASLNEARSKLRDDATLYSRYVTSTIRRRWPCMRSGG